MNRSGIIYPDPNDTLAQPGYIMADNQVGGLPDNANNTEISENLLNETQALGMISDFDSKDAGKEVSSDSELTNDSYWDKNSLDAVVSLMQKGSNVPDFSSRKSFSADAAESKYKFDSDKRQYDDVLVGKKINSGDKNNWSSVEEKRKNNLRNFSNTMKDSHTEDTEHDKSTDKTEIDKRSAYGKGSVFKINGANTKDESDKTISTDTTANTDSTFRVNNSKVEKISKDKKSERPEKSDGMLLSFMFIFEIFRWFMGTDVIVRFILGAIAGVVGFGLIFSRLGALGYF